MRKTGIALLSILMCLGGRPPIVFAEEIESEPEDSTSETLQEEEIETIEETMEEVQSEEADIPEEPETNEPQESGFEGINIVPSSHGSVEIKRQSKEGDVPLYSAIATPNQGCHFESMKLVNEDGADIGAIINGNIATFCAAPGHTITIHADFVNDKNFEVRQTGQGEILDEHIKQEDGSYVYRFTAVPAEGYKLCTTRESLYATDPALNRLCTADGSDTIEVRDNGERITVVARFVRDEAHLITTSTNNTDGDLSIQIGHRAVTEAWVGENVRVDLYPKAGYQADEVHVLKSDFTEVETTFEDEYTRSFIMPDEPVSVYAVFGLKTFDLAADTDAHCSVSFRKNGTETDRANIGDEITCSYEVQDGYEVTQFEVVYTVNGVDLPVRMTDGQFTMPYYDLKAICRTQPKEDADAVEYIDENGNPDYAVYVRTITSSKNLTLTTGWYVVNGLFTTIDKRVEIQGDVNIILPDNKFFYCKDGIHNSEGNSLTIWGQAKGNGYLEAQNAGQDKAGIGGNKNENGGTFVLHGGRIYSEGGDEGAGVGGGKNGSGGNIRIYGGYLHSIGNDNAAGIGGGEYGRGGDIRIYGGEVIGAADDYEELTDLFNAGGAGIGGGEDRDGGYIEINGGTVHATGGSGFSGGGAGIGGGDEGSGGTIVINGGNVVVHGASGAGIGGGEDGNGGSITINGGNILAKSWYGAGIGIGDKGKTATVAINGGRTEAWLSEHNPPFGDCRGPHEAFTGQIITLGDNVGVAGWSYEDRYRGLHELTIPASLSTNDMVILYTIE